jgi:hypothetical protein
MDSRTLTMAGNNRKSAPSSVEPLGLCQSVQPDLAPEGARVTPKDVGGWSGCSGAYQGVCLSGCTLQICTQRRCTCTVPS